MNPMTPVPLARLRSLARDLQYDTHTTECGAVHHLDLDYSRYAGQGDGWCTEQENVQWSKQFTYFSSNHATVLRTSALSDLFGDSETTLPLSDEEAGPWWLDIFNASEGDIRAICAALKVHPLISEDIITHQTREKLEPLGNYYFLSLRSFIADQQNRHSLPTTNLYLVAFQSGLLSFSFGQGHDASQVRNRIGRLNSKDMRHLSTDWITYAFLDEIVDDLMARVRGLRTKVESIDDSAITARTDDYQVIRSEIQACYKIITVYTSLLGDKVDVIQAFMKRHDSVYSERPKSAVEDVSHHMDDVKDHVVTMLSDLDDLEQTLENVHSNFISQMKMLQVHRTKTWNKLLVRVNFILALFLFLNLIPSLFTVNVPFPGINSTGLGWFFGIIGFMLAVTICSVSAARWRRIF